ncbi:hypothetical protein AeMF1_005951 [Aphanomyces euteiches]|nr:hypothetical protein AeMF1_005951 [Aphanomyces euteiches]KAH9181115.1 hypothetical protein AeNC1_016907 [Aphanomyces euteiches]
MNPDKTGVSFCYEGIALIPTQYTLFFAPQATDPPKMKLCVAAFAVVVLSAISSSYTDARSLRVADAPAMHLSFLDEGAPTRIGNDAVDGSMIDRNLEAAGKKHKKHKKSKHAVAAPEEGESARLLKEEM